MKIRYGIASAILLGLAISPIVHADDDLTMDVVELGQVPQDIVNTIVLPDSAAEQARTSSAFGLETANRARQMRGNETAAEARELGREFGERMAEDARGGHVSEQVRERIEDARNNPGRRPPRP
jgi:hypothetical protein